MSCSADAYFAFEVKICSKNQIQKFGKWKFGDGQMKEHVGLNFLCM